MWYPTINAFFFKALKSIRDFFTTFLTISKTIIQKFKLKSDLQFIKNNYQIIDIRHGISSPKMNLELKSKEVLEKWFQNNITHPYATKED